MKNLDWENLSFGYIKTDYNVRCYWRDGKWGELEVHDEETITMNMAATCLHYGQESFEGLKVFRGKDGDIRIFRPEENARRMQKSADYVLMKCPPEELYLEAIDKVVKLNEKYIPPYGTGASLYIRPLLIGTGGQVGVKPADEYLFVIFVTPVGPYYKDGFKPINIIVERNYDRAAPHGTGGIKIGGNYAASLLAGEKAHKKGYPAVLYLDAKEKRYIDESGAANFFAIRDNTYITPASGSILPSITNMSLREIAKDMGLNVEQRPVEFAELPSFEEVGSCGTAAVVTPIGKIVDEDNGKTYNYCPDGRAGKVTTELYNRLRAIQLGEAPDTRKWVKVL